MPLSGDGRVGRDHQFEFHCETMSAPKSPKGLRLNSPPKSPPKNEDDDSSSDSDGEDYSEANNTCSNPLAIIGSEEVSVVERKVKPLCAIVAFLESRKAAVIPSAQNAAGSSFNNGQQSHSPSHFDGNGHQQSLTPHPFDVNGQTFPPTFAFFVSIQ